MNLNSAHDAIERMIHAGLRISGRSGRREFWLPVLITIFLFGIFSGLMWMFTSGDLLESSVRIALLLVAAGTFIPFVTLSIRRVHDFGISGLWLLPPLLLAFIWPILAIVIYSCFFLLPGTSGENKYGAQPHPLAT